MRNLLILNIIVLLILGCGAFNLVQGKHHKRRSYRSRMTPELARKIVKRANYYHLDPFLVLEVMRVESQFNPNATSPVGAAGLMQFMPATAARFGINNAYDPDQAIDAGCRYLVTLIRQFNGRLDLVLAGYNAGEHNVIKYNYQVPPFAETRNYVCVILNNYKQALVIAAQVRQRRRLTTPMLTNAQVKERLRNIDQQLALLQ